MRRSDKFGLTDISVATWLESDMHVGSRDAVSGFKLQEPLSNQ